MTYYIQNQLCYSLDQAYPVHFYCMCKIKLSGIRASINMCKLKILEKVPKYHLILLLFRIAKRSISFGIQILLLSSVSFKAGTEGKLGSA